MRAEIVVFQNPELDGLILGRTEYAGEVTLEVQASHIAPFLEAMKTQLGYNYLSDITATDYYTDHKRFGIAYNLVSLGDKKRIRVFCRVEEENPEVHTVSNIWTSANWYERECWDMMGIVFKGHPDLRRIFMPEDFEYHPLRKEFPLIGIPGSIQVPEKDPPKEYK